jgi:hypothetical protein
VPAVQVKKQIEIEALLRWTYLDELPKRQTSAAEGIWDRLAQNGSLGGIDPDPGHGAAQRYAHFGLPHRDAEAIELAVGRLGSTAIDWDKHFDLIAGDLAALIDINDLQRGSGAWRSTKARGSGWAVKGHLEKGRVGDLARNRGFVVTDNEIAGKIESFSYIRGHHQGKLRKGIRARPADRPRDVLLLNTVDVAALVITHTIKGTRPDWRSAQMRPVPTLAERSALSVVIGKSKGKNLYTTGAYCPLRWEPSPLSVVLARADYLVWWDAIERLAGTLELAEHQLLPPAAARTPWIDGEVAHRTFANAPARTSTLPLKPQRKRTGAPARKPNNSDVRHPLAPDAAQAKEERR